VLHRVSEFLGRMLTRLLGGVPPLHFSRASSQDSGI
jgi:hypothetical protein